MFRFFRRIKLWVTDRPYYKQWKRYVKRQDAVRKKLKKQAKEFCPWSGYYMHEMIKTMLDFYHETYRAGDCCWSESARIGKKAESLQQAVDAAEALDEIDNLDYAELTALAKKDGVAFTNFVNKCKEQFDTDILAGPHGNTLLGDIAYTYLEKKYTKKIYNTIGNHIWEWYD